MQSSKFLLKPPPRKIFFFTNFFAPYRIGLFNELDRLLDRQIVFFFDTKSSPHREWKVDHKTIKYQYQILNGKKFNIVRYCLKNKPKVIISCEFGLRTILCIIAGKLIGAKIIVFSELTSSSEKSCSLIRKILRKFIAPLIDGGIAVGKESRQYLLYLGITKSRIVIAPDAVDNDFFIKESAKYNKNDLHKLFKIPEDYFIFIFVGTICLRKGIDLLFRAFEKTSRQTNKKFLCLLVGDRVKSKEGKKLLKYYDNKLFKIIEFQQAHSLVKYLVLGDCLIFPTRKDVWGMIINEAIASGLPVAVSKYAQSASELIDNGKNGYVFDPLDSASFENTIIKCIDNRSLLKQFSIRAKDKLKINNHHEAAKIIATFMLKLL